MRRHTNEQDKALATINDALGDLQRMGEVSSQPACVAYGAAALEAGTSHAALSVPVLQAQLHLQVTPTWYILAHTMELRS